MVNFVCLLQLVNHNVPEDVVEGMKASIQGFFELPAETKKQVAQEPGQLEGYGQLFVVSEDQKLDWADSLYLKTQPLQDRSLRFWPDQPAGFRYIHTHNTINVSSHALIDFTISCFLFTFKTELYTHRVPLILQNGTGQILRGREDHGGWPTGRHGEQPGSGAGGDRGEMRRWSPVGEGAVLPSVRSGGQSGRHLSSL